MNKVVELPRDIVINFDMVIFGNENKEELTAAISTANLMKINVINDIAVVDAPVNKKTRPERQSKTKDKKRRIKMWLSQKNQRKKKNQKPNHTKDLN